MYHFKWKEGKSAQEKYKVMEKKGYMLLYNKSEGEHEFKLTDGVNRVTG